MANGNGNNINTDDAAATTNTTTTAQEQQHLAGDGSGACGDVKLPTGARGNNVNDLVADLWLNGSNNSISSRGDYTNIRATTTTTTAAPAAPATAAAASTTSAASSSSTSTFSFKHFLNSSGTITAPSSTVTSLDATCSASSNSNSGPSCSSNTNATVTSASSLQTSTGARPKVPQSASVSHMQPDLNGSAASKMKRSPRFSSFDSQASLAEYAACGSSGVGGIITSSSSSSGTRLRPDLRLEVDRSSVGMDDDDDDYDHLGLAQVRNSRLYDERVDDDIFPSSASNLHAGSSSSRYVPRSYSSYDMPPNAAACAASSPRRRPALRPNRLVLATVPKMKLDLPLEAASNVAGAASALPDFVQDHLSDAWCQEAHLSSPPNSPMGAGAEAPSCSGAAGSGSGIALLLPAAVAAGLSSASTLPAASESTVGSTVKMLPDFLSDGPILHSSQRLADVAIGLPSNTIDSPPQEADAALSTLRQENERLQRELQELRLELNVQRRRAQDFERQVRSLTEARLFDSHEVTAKTQEIQRLQHKMFELEATYFAVNDDSDQVAGAAAAGVGGSGVSGSGVGGAGVASEMTRQRLQREAIKREATYFAVNDDSDQVAGAAATGVGGGVVGGTGVASEITPGSHHSNSSNTSRPSRTHNLSRDLLRAADNADQNLRQLLAGVENLRQMAASLEQPGSPAATPRSPNPFARFDFN